MPITRLLKSPKNRLADSAISGDGAVIFVVGIGDNDLSSLKSNNFKVVLTFYMMDDNKPFFLTALKSAIKK